MYEHELDSLLDSICKMVWCDSIESAMERFTKGWRKPGVTEEEFKRLFLCNFQGDA